MSLRKPSSTEPGGTDSRRHQSLALPLLIKRLGGGLRRRVLDLGPAVGGNVAYLAGLSCRVHIADLHQSLFPTGEARPAMTGEAFRSLLARDLPSAEGFDVVLAWDLLDYLEESRIRILSRHLARLVPAGSLLLLLVSTRREIPDRPNRFEILDSDHLAYDLDAGLLRPGPRYKEPVLHRCLPEFEVESTFLLRNGIQEYLFARRPI